jgi:ArsR family transcriptional regulator, arsenate/arsenite/antimonite-responsive transcriptional repressor
VDDGALVRILKALAEPRRLRMIQELAAAGELSCGQIGERFPLSQPTISHHLKILHDAGILVVRREGQHGFVSVNKRLLDAALKSLPSRLKTGPRRARKAAATGKARR